MRRYRIDSNKAQTNRSALPFIHSFTHPSIQSRAMDQTKVKKERKSTGLTQKGLVISLSSLTEEYFLDRRIDDASCNDQNE